MFNLAFSAIRSRFKEEDVISRRRYERRDMDRCICIINGQSYPVENWSFGGLLIQGDSRPFGIDNEIHIVLRFKLRNKIVDIPHRGRVVRKTKDTVAFEFMPITTQIRNNLQNVIDDFVASQFAESQLR